MKKLLCTLVIFVLLLSMTLSSCAFLPTMQQNNNQQNNQQTSLTSEQVMAKITDAMESLASYEISNALSITAYVAAKKMNITGTSKRIVSGTSENDLYFYSNSDITVKYAGAETENISLEAFNDGKYFYSYSIDDQETKMYSELTAAEFKEYYENKADGLSYSEGYNSITHTKNADGSYTVVLSDFDKKNINSFNAAYGLPAENGGGKISGCTVTISADANYRVTRTLVNYTFSNTSFSGTETITYSNFNSAQRIFDTIDPEDYSKIGDARAIPMTLSLISDKQESDSEKFNFSFTETIKIAGQRMFHEEYYEGSYGVNDGRYYFDIDSKVNGSETEISYKKGIYRVNGVKDDSSEFTDETAKMFIDEFIAPLSLNPVCARGITVEEKLDGTVYKINLDPYGENDIGMMISAIYLETGATHTSSEATLDVKVNDYELIYAIYSIESKGYIRQGNSTYEMSITIRMATEFPRAE